MRVLEAFAVNRLPAGKGLLPHVRRFAALSLLLLPAFVLLSAQQQAGADPSGSGDEIVIPVRARKLSGYVHMAIQKNTAVARVRVEEYDATWNRVLGSTYTDYYGHFSLKPAHGRKVHLLRLSAKGFAPANYAVTVAADAPAELMLELKLSSDPVEAPYRKAPGFSYAAVAAPPLLAWLLHSPS